MMSQGEMKAFLDDLEAGKVATDRHLTTMIWDLFLAVQEAERERPATMAPTVGTPFYHKTEHAAREVAEVWATDPRIKRYQLSMEPYNGWVIGLTPAVHDLTDYASHAEIHDGRKRYIPADKKRPAPCIPTPSAGKGSTPAGEPRTPGGPPLKGATAMVWAIASDIAAKGGDRKAIMEACVAAGINPATAGTQYSKWKKAQ